MRVNVKVASGHNHLELRKTLSKVHGLKSLTQVFPDEEDPELSGLYVIDVEPSDLDSVLAKLRSSPDVEYVEETAPRKLIR